MPAFTGRENFYVIVGSSAGALIGLQFAVITLIADKLIAPGQAQAVNAFATPAIVHFGAVLLLSVCYKRYVARSCQRRSSLGSLGPCFGVGSYKLSPLSCSPPVPRQF